MSAENNPVNLQPHDRVIVAWDCDATRIPSGEKTVLRDGAKAFVMQTLGGDITLQLGDYSGLVQVSAKDACALYREGTTKPQKPSAAAKGDASAVAPTGPVEEHHVWEVLKTCYDPEIPVNIVDLGLVYDMQITPRAAGGSRIDVKMTLTAMGCGMGPHIAANAQNKLLSLPGVEEAHVEIVWDPPWNQNMISEDGKKRLGLY